MCVTETLLRHFLGAPDLAAMGSSLQPEQPFSSLFSIDLVKMAPADKSK